MPEFDLTKLTIGDFALLEEANAKNNPAIYHLLIPMAAKCAGIAEESVKRMPLTEGADFLCEFSKEIKLNS